MREKYDKGYDKGTIIKMQRVYYPDKNRCPVNFKYHAATGKIDKVGWDNANLCYRYLVVDVVDRDGHSLPDVRVWPEEIAYVDFSTATNEPKLELMRNFGTGATRNNDADKLDFEGFLSPIVLQRYAEYLHKHRVQADGKLRDSDNWQKLFGDNHLDVCMKSAIRHLMSVWLLHRGFPAKDEKGDPVGLEDSVCGVLFNLQAYLYKLLKD